MRHGAAAHLCRRVVHFDALPDEAGEEAGLRRGRHATLPSPPLLMTAVHLLTVRPRLARRLLRPRTHPSKKRRAAGKPLTSLLKAARIFAIGVDFFTFTLIEWCCGSGGDAVLALR